ncbi:MAG TPA: acetylglutamate kinase [Dissulfurispiraceae bacterium]|nr:acetylglutamate kinase [Dissulfurispiraceae bacterium]
MMKKLLEKANILIESLPYIRNFYGKTFVIKYGGAAQIDDTLKKCFAQDVVLFNFIGIRTVIVHGGGPKISETMKRMGKEPTFVQGQRVTDRETMDIVEMVLGGLINKEIVSLINGHGGRAVGLSGKDAGLIRAKKKLLKKGSKKDEELIDIGLVGEVQEINPSILNALERDGFIPVISPIGVRRTGEALNINADYVASAIASALKAEKLVLLTDVPGIKDGEGNVMSTLNKLEIMELINEGIVSGGMLPKVQACTNAIDSGVMKTHIVDGRVPHSLLLEIFTNEGIGTEIIA